MLPKIGASYIAKQVAQRVMEPPKSQQEEPDAQSPQSRENDRVYDDLHGQVFHDEEGVAVGRAYRVDVAVYVVADRFSNRDDELKRCLQEPERRIFLRGNGSKISDLIFAADPNRPEDTTVGLRADDV